MQITHKFEINTIKSIKIGDMRVDFYSYEFRGFGQRGSEATRRTKPARANGTHKNDRNARHFGRERSDIGVPEKSQIFWGIRGVPENEERVFGEKKKEMPATSAREVTGIVIMSGRY
ncbi:MAG: hypothetical protein IJC20_01225 [Clostridia bacterium]|nr:hypothetical protein [Clostridia bacterium]